MKLQGRDLYKALGEPKTIVAPMVDQSELAWRLLSRKHGADLCYTPMFNAKLFANNATYRKDNFGEKDGDPATDRPLIVQFCANDPEELLKAAQHVEDRCDAVDLNLGCPQGIARKGHYGSFLMEDWDLIYRLINKLHTELKIPVTAKIRRYDTKEKTLEYAKMVLSAGAQFLTLHCRTREMKGQATGLADWSYAKYLRDNLPEDTVLFVNGNIIYPGDIEAAMRETGADAVMSAETNLVNPSIFRWREPITDVDAHYPRVDKVLREYFEIAKATPGRINHAVMKTHFFKLLRSFAPHHIDIRNSIGPLQRGEFDKYEGVVKAVEERVEAAIAADPAADKVTKDGEYWSVPYWRCQPLFRVVDGVKTNGKRPQETDEAIEKRKKIEERKRKAADESLQEACNEGKEGKPEAEAKVEPEAGAKVQAV